MIGIYKFTNKINGKVYIGQSINIDKRVKEHFWKSFCEKDVSFTSVLHTAIRKYGKDNFFVEVLEECSVEKLDEREQFYIKKYNCIVPNGYNILIGGQKNKKPIIKYCKQCGKQLYKYNKIGLCQDCFNIKRQENIPPKEEIIKILKQNKGNFSKTGRIFKVTDNAVRKWCKHYNLPFHSSDYK